MLEPTVADLRLATVSMRDSCSDSCRQYRASTSPGNHDEQRRYASDSRPIVVPSRMPSMLYHEAVSEIVKHNGPDQRYTFCTAFLGKPPEHRVSTSGLCRNDFLEHARGCIMFGIERAGGKAWVTRGPNLVLRPTPEYCRMTTLGIEEPCAWRFNENDLLDQVDDICTGDVLRLVACCVADATWSASISDLPGIPREERRRTPPFRAGSLEAALWGAVRVYRRDPLPQRADAS